MPQRSASAFHLGDVKANLTASAITRYIDYPPKMVGQLTLVLAWQYGGLHALCLVEQSSSITQITAHQETFGFI